MQNLKALVSPSSTDENEEKPPPNKIVAWTKNTTAFVANRVKLAIHIAKVLCILLTFLVSLINVIVMIISLTKNGLFSFDQGELHACYKLQQ